MKSSAETFKKLGCALYEIQKYTLIVLCILVTAINISQIMGRYLFFYSIPWSEQVSVILFVFIIFIGQSLATMKDNEIRIDVFVVPGHRVGDTLLILSDLICLIVLAVLFFSAIGLVGNALRFPQVVSSINLPYYVVFAVIPFGFFLIFVTRLLVLVRRIWGLSGNAAQSEGNE
ncbi:TRAP transporter small permease [uncultured Cohaesibacter sp.]|uniref:TRAP transporter small permease n=1 Tax=uncultured Cohaesibacter sp. TaxID=1002546 RepID=UPI0029C8FD88|nr:TRAP transporter small permease [uncultured Cohaesibacter sp.]